MDSNSMEHIYGAINTIANGKLDHETEERVAQSIEQELLKLRARFTAGPAALLHESSQGQCRVV